MLLLLEQGLGNAHLKEKKMCNADSLGILLMLP